MIYLSTNYAGLKILLNLVSCLLALFHHNILAGFHSLGWLDCSLSVTILSRCGDRRGTFFRLPSSTQTPFKLFPVALQFRKLLRKAPRPCSDPSPLPLVESPQQLLTTTRKPHDLLPKYTTTKGEHDQLFCEAKFLRYCFSCWTVQQQLWYVVHVAHLTVYCRQSVPGRCKGLSHLYSCENYFRVITVIPIHFQSEIVKILNKICFLRKETSGMQGIQTQLCSLEAKYLNFMGPKIMLLIPPNFVV